jgi:hypothetical protein
MICRVSPKLPRGRRRDAIFGTVVTCGLPVNFVPRYRPKWQQNLAQTAGLRTAEQYPAQRSRAHREWTTC